MKNMNIKCRMSSVVTLIMTLSCTITRASWTEHQIATLSLEEKIGQLLMVDMRPQIEQEHKRLSLYFGIDIPATTMIDYQEQVRSFITHNHSGGIIFMKGDPITQVKLINLFQSEAKLP